MSTSEEMSDSEEIPKITETEIVFDISIAKKYEKLHSLLVRENEGDFFLYEIASPSVVLKVMEWVDHHKNDLPPPREDPYAARRNIEVDDWDKNYLKIEVSELLDLLMAAHRLEIEELLDLTCWSAAQRIGGKSTDQIRGIFNLPNDWEPGEEERLRETHNWPVEEDEEGDGGEKHGDGGELHGDGGEEEYDDDGGEYGDGGEYDDGDSGETEGGEHNDDDGGETEGGEHDDDNGGETEGGEHDNDDGGETEGGEHGDYGGETEIGDGESG